VAVLNLRTRRFERICSLGLKDFSLPGQAIARKSAFAIYDITDPTAVRCIDMVVSDGDRAPEGMKAFRAGERYFLAVAHETSDTTSLFEIKATRSPSTPR
jgi:hypothetical protein